MNHMSDEDTRKRGHQDDIDAAISSKRAALGSIPPNTHYMDHNMGAMGGMPPGAMVMHGMQAMHLGGDMNLFFKVLCPQSITGLIIGRGGSIIKQIDATCGAKIRLSQNNEYFPGTTERILILNGSKEGIANGVRELVTRIAEAPDRKPNGAPNLDMYGNPILPANRGANGTFQIKVVIPKTASAAIIGKGGSVIKQMAELSNCKFQLGDESDPYNTKERIVIINSTTVPNLVLGVQTIMAQLLDDPRVRNYNTTHTNYGGPGGAPGGPGGPMGGPMVGGPMGGSGGGMPRGPPQGMMGGMMPAGGQGYGMPMPAMAPHHSPFAMQGGYPPMMPPPGAMPMHGMSHMQPPNVPNGNPQQQQPPYGMASPPPYGMVQGGGVRSSPPQGAPYMSYGFPPNQGPYSTPQAQGGYPPQAQGGPYGPPQQGGFPPNQS